MYHKYSQHSMENKTVIECNLIICGETMVGKSSLVNRLISDSFNDNQSSTLNASKQTKEIPLEDATIQFNIVDTPGQERFRSMNKLFYKKADVVLLIYDIISERTFSQIKNYWLKEIVNNSINKPSKTIYFYQISYCNCS